MAPSRLPPNPQPAAAVVRFRGYTNREFAEALGYSPTWVSLVLRGRRRPSPAFRAKVAAYLDLPDVVLWREPGQGAV